MSDVQFYRAEEHYAELFAQLRDMKTQLDTARDIIDRIKI